MKPADLQRLLQAVASGEKDIETALTELRMLPFQDLGFARVDHHRALRQGTPEVIFGAGKEPHEIAAIAQELIAKRRSLRTKDLAKTPQFQPPPFCMAS